MSVDPLDLFQWTWNKGLAWASIPIVEEIWDIPEHDFFLVYFLVSKINCMNYKPDRTITTCIKIHVLIYLEMLHFHLAY